MTESLLPEHRERLYPATPVHSMFMGGGRAGSGRRELVPKGGGQLDSATRVERLERAQCQYGCLLQGAPAIAAHDGQYARPALGDAVG
jgi:hypothetical protein